VETCPEVELAQMCSGQGFACKYYAFELAIAGMVVAMSDSKERADD
jgi:hypothetical protein